MNARRQTGFMLIEVVCALAILGVMAVCTTIGLQYMVRGYCLTNAAVNDAITAQDIQKFNTNLSYISSISAVNNATTPNTITCDMGYPSGATLSGVTITAPSGYSFTFFDGAGNATTTPGSIKCIQVSVTASASGTAAQNFVTRITPYQIN